MPVIYPLNPNIVVIHGYEIHCGKRLGPLAEAVCAAALPILQSDPLKRAILVGGWHLKEAGDIITIADAMELWLLEQGVHRPGQIITQKRFPELAKLMPARDTWEEIVLLQKMFQALRISKEQSFDFIAWDFHVPRLMNIYRTYRFMRPTALLVTPQPYKGLRYRKRREWAARVLYILDPTGHGVLCHENRIKRTLAERKEQLIP